MATAEEVSATYDVDTNGGPHAIIDHASEGS
jgi:hypothetical protein